MEIKRILAVRVFTESVLPLRRIKFIHTHIYQMAANRYVCIVNYLTFLKYILIHVVVDTSSDIHLVHVYSLLSLSNLEP